MLDRLRINWSLLRISHALIAPPPRHRHFARYRRVWLRALFGWLL